MAKSDGGLRALIRERLRPMGHWISIETGGTDQGVPDMNVCAEGGVETWIECKFTDGYAVTVRPQQVGWALARTRRGGRVLFAVRRRCAAGPRREAADELWIVRGHLARELSEGGLRWAETIIGRGAVSWSGGPAKWSWPALSAMLVREWRS